MAEVLGQFTYDFTDLLTTIQKEVADGYVTISVIEKLPDKPEEVVNTVRYRDIGREYLSPFLSWINLIFCSNSLKPAPFYEYMNSAVQAGKKTAATVYVEPGSPAAQHIINFLPEDCDWRPYGDTMIFVFHKGCLADYFDLAEIRAIYNQHFAFDVDWLWVEEQFQKPLSYFADREKCGFSLHGEGHRGETAVIHGLILGYPVESTIANLQGGCN